MKRILTVVIVLFAALSLNAADRFARDPEQISISTTGRIMKIDLKNKTLRVRGSDGQNMPIRNVSQNISQMMQGLKQRMGVTIGGISIVLPGRDKKSGSKPSASPGNNLDDYSVVVRADTVFQDGAEPIRFEDFKAGETISIRGVLSGSVLTASRIAKWD